MFNLPWYSWFNVLALPILWLFMTLDFSVLGVPKWIKQLSKVYIAAAVAVIFLYWNPQLYTTLVPVNYLLVVLIAPFAIWNILGPAYSILEIVYQLLTRSTTPEIANNAVAVEPAVASFNLDDADVDLDGGQTCRSLEKETEMMGENIGKLVSSKSSGRDKYEAFLSMAGADEEPDALVLYISIATFLFYVVVSLPPFYMALSTVL